MMRVADVGDDVSLVLTRCITNISDDAWPIVVGYRAISIFCTRGIRSGGHGSRKLHITGGNKSHNAQKYLLPLMQSISVSRVTVHDDHYSLKTVFFASALSTQHRESQTLINLLNR